MHNENKYFTRFGQYPLLVYYRQYRVSLVAETFGEKWLVGVRGNNLAINTHKSTKALVNILLHANIVNTVIHCLHSIPTIGTIPNHIILYMTWEWGYCTQIQHKYTSTCWASTALTVGELEAVGGLGGPQPHGVDSGVLEAWDGVIISHGHDHLGEERESLHRSYSR